MMGTWVLFKWNRCDGSSVPLSSGSIIEVPQFYFCGSPKPNLHPFSSYSFLIFEMVNSDYMYELHRVFRAVHVQDHRVAACKMVTLTTETTEHERKMLDKEMRVHSALKHTNVLEFLNAVVVEPNKPSPYYPGLYMLLEIAAGGDLFDKIGMEYTIGRVEVEFLSRCVAPDVGVGEDVSHYYFSQLIAGLVST